MDCNSSLVPHPFLADVNGFDGRPRSEQAGHQPGGAKLVNVSSNSVVPKITLIPDHGAGSFGAGKLRLCGKASTPVILRGRPPGTPYGVTSRPHAAGHPGGRAEAQPSRPDAAEL